MVLTVVFLTVLTFRDIWILEKHLVEWLCRRGFMRLAQQVQHTLPYGRLPSMQARELAFSKTNAPGNLMVPCSMTISTNWNAF